MTASVISLPWLPLPPPDFVARCNSASDDIAAGRTLAGLATFRLSSQQSLVFMRALKRCRACGADLAPLTSFKLGILASATYDLLIDCFPAAAARHGVALDIVTTPYDQVMQQALDPQSEVNCARIDAALIAVDHRWLKLDRAEFGLGVKDRIAEAVSRLRAVVENLQANGDAPCILQTVPAPPQTLFGSYDRRMPGSTRAMIAEINREIVSLAQETENYVFDVAALAERIGTDLWFDPVHWASYKLPFSAECFPIYADMLGRLLGAIRGKARKCLVLDLDNTLWGGVIGDDGLEGIKLGQGSAMGESFLSVQQYALALRERGIVLAVCSKNDDETARRPFREHPEMLLKLDHVAVFQANWTGKPANLEAIAKSLNLGLDALVMLDDNPAERAQIRAALPMVAVPELPSDPSWYPWFLSAAGYFEAVSYSAEDGARAATYAADAHRAQVMESARDVGEYLHSLDMVVHIAPFDAKGRLRIAQLINKTNQFNLTTRRYTEAQVARMETNPDLITLQVRLADKFGDLGMIGVIVAKEGRDPGAWEIDTWLMSCRVLGRRVEEAMLAALVSQARKHGASRLIGSYIPTAKNAMVADHYPRLGFAALESGDEEKRFVLLLDGWVAPDLPFAPLAETPAP